MKKLTAMLAILLALMLTLPCALAENSTTYSLSLLDPILSQDGETVFDLTGLNVDLVASVTDGAAQALSLELYAGDNYDYITSLQIQLAEEGIVLHLDGMSQSYCLSYDQLAEMMGRRNGCAGHQGDCADGEEHGAALGNRSGRRAASAGDRCHEPRYAPLGAGNGHGGRDCVGR